MNKLIEIICNQRKQIVTECNNNDRCDIEYPAS